MFLIGAINQCAHERGECDRGKVRGRGQSPSHKREHKTSGVLPRSKTALLSVCFFPLERYSSLPAALLAPSGLTSFGGPTNHSSVPALEQASFTLPSLTVLSIYNLSLFQVIIICQI